MEEVCLRIFTSHGVALMAAQAATASAPTARASIWGQHRVTNLADTFDTRAKSLPTRERARAASGSPLQPFLPARYLAIEPQRMMKATWRRVVMERLDRNSAQMCSGPRPWSKIRSDVVQYPISRAPSTLAASVKLHEAIGTPLRLASGKHGGAVAIVEKLRELPLRLRGFVRSLGRWSAPNNFAHAIIDCCLVGMTHPGELFEGVRRGELRRDFRGAHRREHEIGKRMHRGRFAAAPRPFVTFCVDYPAKSWVSVASRCVMLASHHRRHYCAARPADTRSNRPREGEPGYATSSAARDGFLHCRAAGECEGQS
jgi:hypothetical protein